MFHGGGDKVSLEWDPLIARDQLHGRVDEQVSRTSASWHDHTCGSYLNPYSESSSRPQSPGVSCWERPHWYPQLHSAHQLAPTNSPSPALQYGEGHFVGTFKIQRHCSETLLGLHISQSPSPTESALSEAGKWSSWDQEGLTLRKGLR